MFDRVGHKARCGFVWFGGVEREKREKGFFILVGMREGKLFSLEGWGCGERGRIE